MSFIYVVVCSFQKITAMLRMYQDRVEKMLMKFLTDIDTVSKPDRVPDMFV